MTYADAVRNGIGHLHPAASGARVAIPPAIAAAIAAAKPIQPTKPAIVKPEPKPKTKAKKARKEKAPPAYLSEEPIGGKAPNRFDSALEWEFWGKLWASFEAGHWCEVDEHCLKVRAIADVSWYTIDFVARNHKRHRTIFETKGYWYPKDWARFLGAVTRYPEWRWVVVEQPKRGQWDCYDVTAAGKSKEIWRPEWLY